MLKPAFVDLSHHNTIPESLKPARESGILGVIHKLTEGSSYIDDDCDARHKLATDAKMLWGLYHFVRPGNMSDQAQFFVETSIELGVADDTTLYCLDYEDAGVSLDDCVEFMAVVEDMTAHESVIYSGHVLKEKLKGMADPRLVKYRLWVAQYGPNAVLPPGWDTFWGWQYTDRGSCPGIKSPVDLNAYIGTAKELENDWSGHIEMPQPSKQVVKITIEAPQGVRVDVVRK